MAVKISRDECCRRQKFLESQAAPLKGIRTNTCMDSIPLSSSVGAADWKAWDIWGRTELSSIRARQSGGQLFPGQKYWQRPLFLFWALYANSHRAGRRAPYLRLHQPGSHCLPHAGGSLTPYPTQLSGPPQLIPVASSYKWLVLAHASEFSKFSETGNIWLQQALYFPLSCPRPSTSSSWP